jgi:hypothetical protein
MLNGWSFNWESMATREREGLETRCVERWLVTFICVIAILIDAKRQVLLPIGG